MEKIFKTEKELSVYPTLRSSIHHESDIYIVDDETLYKILLYGNRLTRESVVQRLSLYDNPDCVTPTGAIYTPQYEFLGFKMPYLKNYVPSTKLIFSKKVSYKDKLKFARKIAIAIEKLSKDGIVFWDIHPDNNMINKNGDIKIIDMDSVNFKEDYDGDEFRFKVAASHGLLSQLSLSYLAKINIMELAKTLPEETLKEMFSSVFKGGLYNYVDGIFGFPDEIIYPSEFLPYIEEKDLIDLRETLIRKLRK